ncbi:DUF6415 family natural product biosynthesis protein [Streptomyces sp. NPDC001532]|uniref:DUF6415 family natural product biosynthesis protein n=1 Tax=Streptomyces sp. NPDC001532 TaxID=3154520 RepID=UPI003330FD4D
MDSMTAPAILPTMRAAVRRLLTENTEPPSDEELETLTLRLREHLGLAIPVVEALASGLPEDDIPRACAHAAVMEARARLGAEPRPTPAARIAHAQRLARSVNALCDHYENLSGGQPVVLDPERAAFLRLSDHCVDCSTCSARDETSGANRNLACATAERLLSDYLRGATHGSHDRPRRPAAGGAEALTGLRSLPGPRPAARRGGTEREPLAGHRPERRDA